jgi:hypothetical protein
LCHCNETDLKSVLFFHFLWKKPISVDQKPFALVAALRGTLRIISFFPNLLAFWPLFDEELNYLTCLLLCCYVVVVVALVQIINGFFVFAIYILPLKINSRQNPREHLQVNSFVVQCHFRNLTNDSIVFFAHILLYWLNFQMNEYFIIIFSCYYQAVTCQ